MKLSDVLASPGLYQFYQEVGGFFGARLKAISAYLPLEPGSKVIDVGCGPGVLAKHLPRDVEYVGYEPEKKYFDYAVERFSNIGRFEYGYFDQSAIVREGLVDVVMLNGVLHHMNDQQAAELAELASVALKPGGRLFCFEPCLVEGQNPFARFLINNDRGEYIRALPGYHDILLSRFRKVDSNVDHKFARLPYTFVTLVAHKE